METENRLNYSQKPGSPKNIDHRDKKSSRPALSPAKLPGNLQERFFNAFGCLSAKALVLMTIPFGFVLVWIIFGSIHTQNGGFDVVVGGIWLLLSLISLFWLAKLAEKEKQKVLQEEMKKRYDLFKEQQDRKFAFVHDQLHLYTQIYDLLERDQIIQAKTKLDKEALFLAEKLQKISCPSPVLGSVLDQYEKAFPQNHIIVQTQIETELPDWMALENQQLFYARLVGADFQACLDSSVRIISLVQAKRHGSLLVRLSVSSATFNLPDLSFLPESVILNLQQDPEKTVLDLIFRHED